MVEARPSGANVASRLKYSGEELRSEVRPLIRNLGVSKDFDSGVSTTPG